jgi:hypothetical protein
MFHSLLHAGLARHANIANALIVVPVPQSVRTCETAKTRMTTASSMAAVARMIVRCRRKMASVAAVSCRNAESWRQVLSSVAQPTIATTPGRPINSVPAPRREMCFVVHSKMIQLVRAGSYWRGWSTRSAAAPKNTVAGNTISHSPRATIGKRKSLDARRASTSLYTLYCKAHSVVKRIVDWRRATER